MLLDAYDAADTQITRLSQRIEERGGAGKNMAKELQRAYCYRGTLIICWFAQRLTTKLIPPGFGGYRLRRFDIDSEE